jgi:two-component system, OmpR family, phosphate regulon sensor histidine kinase PhoR
MDRFTPYAYDLDDADIKAQRRKARELRASQWWKRRCAKGVCYYCGRPIPPGELTMDHIVPIARGGKSTKGNIVPACKECNNKKKQLLPMEWEAYLEAHRISGEDSLSEAGKKAVSKEPGPALEYADRQPGTGPNGAERACRPVDPENDPGRMHAIIDSLPHGVMATDAQGRVVMINQNFIQQMDLPLDTVAGGPVADYIADPGLSHLVLEVSQGHLLDPGGITPYEFPVGNEKYLQARCRPLKNEESGCPGGGSVVTLEDITAMKVLDRLKREFVAKVSHELRSPLSTIHELLAAVLNDIVGQVPPTDEHLLCRAKEKTQGLIGLIGDLLDLSRIESGAACESPKPVFLDELLENIIGFIGTRAAAKHLALALDRPQEPLPPVQADPLALESIFSNLITNAISYTPENGRIDVCIARAGAEIRVQVTDNGLGMEARHLEKIFERFYRIKTEQTRYITGTGLGLPIVKGLVDSLGGRIMVESVPGKGSTFTVWLPAAAG